MSKGFLKSWICSSSGASVDIITFTKKGRAWNSKQGAFPAQLQTLNQPPVRTPAVRARVSCYIAQRAGSTLEGRGGLAHAELHAAVFVWAERAVAVLYWHIQPAVGARTAVAEWHFLVCAGDLGTTANAAMMATIYGQVVATNMTSQSNRYLCWSQSQMRYMMGNLETSFMVGFAPRGASYPQHSQDRAASCPNEPSACNFINGLYNPKVLVLC